MAMLTMGDIASRHIPTRRNSPQTKHSKPSAWNGLPLEDGVVPPPEEELGQLEFVEQLLRWCDKECRIRTKHKRGELAVQETRVAIYKEAWERIIG